MDADKKNLMQAAWEDTVVVHARNERSNSDVAVTVNRAIATSVLISFDEAIKLMDEAGISKNIALRVLNSKTRRRATDWQ